jgi:hypothetical protein
VDCSGGDVTQVGIPEEALEQLRELLQPLQRGQRLGLEILGAADPRAVDPVVLDVLPHPRIGVQLRRVPGQEAQPQPASSASADSRATSAGSASASKIGTKSPERMGAMLRTHGVRSRLVSIRAGSAGLC